MPPSSARIFVTVGTHEVPFKRLLDFAQRLAEAGHDVDVQHGYGDGPPPGCTGRAFVSFEEVRQKMSGADLVLTHGGTGSAMLALMLGRKPAVLPRLSRYGDHVDDHQLQIAEELASQDLIWLLSETPTVEEVSAILDDLAGATEPVITSPLGTYLKGSLAEFFERRYPDR